MQQGGGIGYDFSTLRPKGAPVKGVGADASGPLSFMDVWDAMCRTIMSAGHRRGAMMATMRCDHPDIEAFIEAKRDRRRGCACSTSASWSTDAFMRARKDDADWDLVFDGVSTRPLRARALGSDHARDLRCRGAGRDLHRPDQPAEPAGNYCETIAATNPCGEQPLPPYGACLLGSINLSRLVRRPVRPPTPGLMKLAEALVTTAVRMMDNTIDVSRFPLRGAGPRGARQAPHRARRDRPGRCADHVRRCATALMQAVAMTGAWLAAIQHGAYLASTRACQGKGRVPAVRPRRLSRCAGDPGPDERRGA